LVYELEFKYGTNYIEAFVFKQLARNVHYEALDVYKQHFPRILGVTQIPNLAYATTIATTFQAHYKLPLHIMGLCLSKSSTYFSILFFSQLIVITTNIPPTIDVLTFANPVGEFF
jgi:hypothetical protein